jgi:hypothetical protein
MPWDATRDPTASAKGIQPDREENAAEIYKDPAELQWHRFLDS